ncbi:MAG: hypothetical protein JWO74_1579 [Solirubrobacterales bacterium]|nr:hypothetical protein [Solirubrobacterales bacterium]
MRDFLAGVSREHATSLAGGDLRRSPPPDSLLRALRAYEHQLRPSHRWPKGIIATTLALTEPDEP